MSICYLQPKPKLHWSRSAGGPVMYLVQLPKRLAPPGARAHSCRFTRGGTSLPDVLLRTAPVKSWTQNQGSHEAWRLGLGCNLTATSQALGWLTCQHAHPHPVSPSHPPSTAPVPAEFSWCTGSTPPMLPGRCYS